MNTENLSTLKIHKLTQEQYNRELEAGRIDQTALYLTPDNGDLSANSMMGILTEGTGSAYTANVNGVSSLSIGTSFIMIPHTVSTSFSPTLNVNGLGAKNIRRRASDSTSSTFNGNSASWLAANKPIRMEYDGKYWIADIIKPVAGDISGTLLVRNGGTGLSSVATNSYLVGNGTDNMVAKTPDEVWNHIKSAGKNVEGEEFSFVYGDNIPVTYVGEQGAEIFNDYENNIAFGLYSHAEGFNTRAIGECSHVQGKYNIEDINEKYAHIVGNGTSDTNRSNAHTIDWDGNAWYQGDVYVGSTSDKNKDDGSKKLATEDYVEEQLANLDISNAVTIDSTLSIAGQAADAKAVGNALAEKQPVGNYLTAVPDGYAKTEDIPTKTSELTNDSGYITDYTETDPTVPDWAKAATKPTYTASEVGAASIGQVELLLEEKANKSGLTLGVHTDGLVYLFIDGVPHGNGLDIQASVVEGDVFGYVDENNVVVLNGALADGTYTIKYEMENGTVVNIGSMVLDTNVYYSVTNTLTQCTTNNSATKVIDGSSYSATITAKSGYELSSVKVTMGGTDISSTAVSGGMITIANVTGNIVITATATEIVVSYTNLANPSSSDWWADSYLSSSAEQRTGKTGYAVSNFIGPVNVGDVIYIKGVDLTGTVAEYRCAPYKSDKVLHGSYGTGALSTLGGLSTTPITAVTVTATGGQFTNNKSDIKYWRIGGKLNGTANDVIITINEPIE